MEVNPLMTVCLENWICRAYHGVFAEEQRTGNEFSLSLYTTYPLQGNVRAIEDTISYTDLLQIARTAMEKPEALLETVVTNIAEAVKTRFPQVTSVRIALHKITAPVPNFQGRVGVIYEQNYTEE